jgi:hypothetical protein
MLRVRQLVKVYPGPVAALQGIDLDLPNGMFGLLASISTRGFSPPIARESSKIGLFLATSVNDCDDLLYRSAHANFCAPSRRSSGITPITLRFPAICPCRAAAGQLRPFPVASAGYDYHYS